MQAQKERSCAAEYFRLVQWPPSSSFCNYLANKKEEEESESENDENDNDNDKKKKKRRAKVKSGQESVCLNDIIFGDAADVDEQCSALFFDSPYTVIGSALAKELDNVHLSGHKVSARNVALHAFLQSSVAGGGNGEAKNAKKRSTKSLVDILGVSDDEKDDKKQVKKEKDVMIDGDDNQVEQTATATAEKKNDAKGKGKKDESLRSLAASSSSSSSSSSLSYAAKGSGQVLIVLSAERGELNDPSIYLVDPSAMLASLKLQPRGRSTKLENVSMSTSSGSLASPIKSPSSHGKEPWWCGSSLMVAYESLSFFLASLEPEADRVFTSLEQVDEFIDRSMRARVRSLDESGALPSLGEIAVVAEQSAEDKAAAEALAGLFGGAQSAERKEEDAKQTCQRQWESLERRYVSEYLRSKSSPSSSAMIDDDGGGGDVKAKQDKEAKKDDDDDDSSDDESDDDNMPKLAVTKLVQEARGQQAAQANANLKAAQRKMKSSYDCDDFSMYRLHAARRGTRRLDGMALFALHEHLVSIDVNANDFDALPESVTMASRLETLIVRRNCLSSLPSSIEQLKRLRLLDCSRNALRAVPDSLCELRQLEFVSLGYNRLEALPPLFGANYHQVLELVLDGNLLETLPAALGKMSLLHTLRAANNRLSALPDDLINLRGSLRELDLSHNAFARDVPDVVLYLTNLRRLWLSHNDIQRLSPRTQRLVHLRTLDVSGNKLSTLPDSLASLTQLRQLYVGENMFPRLPKVVCSLQTLDTLDFSRNRLQQLNADIGSLWRLRTLRAAHIGIRQLSASFKHLAQLTSLDLSACLLSQLPVVLLHLPFLESLELHSNQLSQLPHNFGEQLCRLRFLDVSSNHLVALPATFSALTRLNQLDIARNQLTSFPFALHAFPSLQHFDFDENPLAPMERSRLEQFCVAFQ
jgi:Leucine-rich repeat (LRR) protein